jgi:hypothetical protein
MSVDGSHVIDSCIYVMFSWALPPAIPMRDRYFLSSVSEHCAETRVDVMSLCEEEVSV